MRRSNKTMAVLAAATIVITAGFAVNNANAVPSNGSMTGTGFLLLCVSEGRGYVVADGPDFVQTPTLNDGCFSTVEVEAGTYFIKTDKYIDAPCWTGAPRQNGALNPKGRCHGKVHHAHYGRYQATNGNTGVGRPDGLELTTIEVPDYTIVNVEDGQTTEVRLHVTDLDYPECLTPPTGRTCDAHPVTGRGAGI